MRIEIEISEEDAACIWANNWKEGVIEQIAAGLIETEAVNFRREFPGAVKKAVEDFRLTDAGGGIPATTAAPKI